MAWLRAVLREVPGSMLQKKRSTLFSLTTQNKTRAAELEWKGGKEGQEKREGLGVFSASVTQMTQTFRQLQNLPTGVKVPQETRLFEILICTCAHKHSKVHACSSTTNKHSWTCQSQYNGHSPEVQTLRPEVQTLRSGRRSGGEKVVYQDPHMEFLFLLSINLSINPLLMGQLWVSSSHLQDANQAHKLRDQPSGQRCSSASEWLFKQGDACIDFSSRLKEKHEGRGQECNCASQGLPALAVVMCESGWEPSQGPQSPSADQGAWQNDLAERQWTCKHKGGKKLEARGGQSWQGQHQQRSQ